MIALFSLRVLQLNFPLHTPLTTFFPNFPSRVLHPTQRGMSNNEVRINVAPELFVRKRLTCPPQELADEVIGANILPEGKLHAMKDVLLTCPPQPQEQAGMNLEKSASLKHEDLVQELSDIDKNLESELDPKEYCIYRVPERIRRVNKEAYTPQLISIGPLHHGKQELANMEKTKRRYVKSFFQRSLFQQEMIKKQDEILSFIKDNEKKICSCYAETSELGSLKYVMIILYDAIFIIELFLRNILGDRIDSFLSIPTVRFTLTSDLELLENQLPFFVLDGICMLAFDGFHLPSFTILCQSFFQAIQGYALIIPQLPIKHITDWRRYTLLKSYPKSGQANGYIRDLPCVMKLQESGVKFKKCEGDKIPFFEQHELQLPYLQVHDGSECQFRNIMALEQCHYPQDTHVCNYVKLMDFLIDTEKDVDLLVGNGIISNYDGNNATTTDMFNKLCPQTTLSRSSYYDMCEGLKKHYNNSWNHTKATLRRVYFSNLWRGTGTLAAVVLLLLTIIQTICSILQM